MRIVGTLLVFWRDEKYRLGWLLQNCNAFCSVIGLYRPSKRHDSPNFEDELQRCKDDAVRHLIVDGCGGLRGKDERRKKSRKNAKK